METSNIFKIFFLVLLLSSMSYSQDSLFLVDTIKGTSTTNPLMDARGIGDMNGDGYADFILHYVNNVDLYYGNSQFKLKPVHSFLMTHYYSPLYDHGDRGSAYPIGDVNGDGYADLMIIDYDTTYYPAYPYCKIIFGGKELDTIPKFIFYPPYKWDMFLANNIYPLGDLNGDGYNDFIISSPYNWGDGHGSIFVFKGGKTISNTPWKVYTATKRTDDQFGYKIIGIGDNNNDTFDDFLVSGIGNNIVYLFRGNKDTLTDYPTEIVDTSIIKFIYDMKPAGDLNNDGKKDFIITTDSNSFVYLGDFDKPLVYDLNKLGAGYKTIGTGGDINNDGYDDFILGNTDYYNSNGIMVGGAFGFFGKSIIDTNKNFLLEGDHKWLCYAGYMDIPGDINGDGFADVFIIQSEYPECDLNYHNKYTGKLFIYSYKKIDVVNDDKNTFPNDFILNQNYPNPFNPSTVITYNLPKGSKVTLKVYDILGKEIKTLADEVQNAGSHSVTFNVSNLSLSSGVYFVKMSAESQNSNKSFNKVIKMMYLK